MKILIINHYAGSLEYGMEYRPYYLAKEWISLGHKVCIIAADFSHLRRKNPEIGKDFESKNIDGIIYYFCKTLKYEGNSGKRALTMFQFTSKLWFRARKIVKLFAPDIVISSSTYPLDNYAARRIARKAKCKLIHEVHDMWPSTLVELGGMSPSHPFIKLLQKAENDAYRKSDAVVSLLPCVRDYMVEHGLKPENFNYIPNGIVMDDWNNPEPLPDGHLNALRDIKAKGNIIVCYFGGHAMSNSLDGILDTAALFKDSNITFCLVGNGVEKPRLIDRKIDENLKNVEFLPPVPKKSIPSLLENIDIICICGKSNKLYRFGVCLNKMYDSMMSGKPIVLSFDIPNDDVKEFGCGISVPAENSQEMAKAIKQLAEMSPENRNKIGNLGHDAVVNKYNYRILAQNFLQVIDKISKDTNDIN